VASSSVVNSSQGARALLRSALVRKTCRYAHSTLQQLRRETRDQPRKTSGRGSAGAAGRTDGRPSAPGIAPGHNGLAKAPISEIAAVGHAPQEAQTSTGDERLDAVEDRIDEAKEAADRVEDNEGLGLRHRETDQHGTFEPSGDDRNAGENPSQGRDAGAPGEASER